MSYQIDDDRDHCDLRGGRLMALFEPSSERGKKIMRAARVRNGRMDRIEANGGFAIPAECPLLVQVRTVLSALFAGIEIKDWDCVAEAAALLQDTELQLRVNGELGTPPESALRWTVAGKILGGGTGRE